MSSPPWMVKVQSAPLFCFSTLSSSLKNEQNSAIYREMWVDLDSVIYSEASQKNKHNIIPFMYRSRIIAQKDELICKVYIETLM